jgi:DNA-binding winged helix-turn-helix (wHTH) protein
MFRFGPFELDVRRYQLRRDDRIVPIQRRPFDLLHYLVERPDVVVTKGELLASVWRGVAVTEDSLPRAIMAVRSALGEDVNDPQFIHTVRGRGYRFVRPVDVVQAAPASSREPFVDRASCLTALRDRVDRTVGGAGSFLLITGAVGVGKTRTLEELERFCATPPRAGSLALLAVRCPSTDGAPHPWLALWLSDWLRRRGIEVGAGFDPSTNATAVSEGLGTNADSYRGFEALAIALQTLADRTPVVLLVDDLHCADEHSLGLVEWLARRTRRTPLLVACASRIDGAYATLPRIGALARDAATRTIGLEAFTREEVATYLQRALGSVQDRSLIDRVFDKSHGNPLLVREAAQALATHLERRHAISTSALVGGEPMRAAVVHHLASLPDAVVGTLTIAAVFGRSFPLTALATALGKTNGTALHELDRAETGRLIRRGAPGTYEFTYPLIRDTLYRGLSLSERARHHAAVAAALESHAGVDCDRDRAAEIARHYVAAAPLGEVDRATAWSLRAVNLAQAAGDHVMAVRCAKLGLEALRFASTPDDERRKRLEEACAGNGAA